MVAMAISALLLVVGPVEAPRLAGVSLPGSLAQAKWLAANLSNVINLDVREEAAKAFNIPVIMGTSWPRGPHGPTMPELKALFP